LKTCPSLSKYVYNHTIGQGTDAAPPNGVTKQNLVSAEALPVASAPQPGIDPW